MRVIEEFLQDLRYGKRLLAKNPGVTLIAILTLALGIGANTAIFSVVNAFLLRPLPYGDEDRLVMVDSQQRGQSVGVSFADYEDWRRQTTVFDDLAFFNLRWNANLEFGSETETLNLTFGTPNLFSTLKVAPLLGHAPTAGDSDTVLLSHGLWQRRFSGDPSIVGRQLRIDGRSLTVTGVILATLLACYIPARRATKVDPLIAALRVNHRVTGMNEPSVMFVHATVLKGSRQPLGVLGFAAVPLRSGGRVR